jgi:hypothetical protein
MAPRFEQISGLAPTSKSTMKKACGQFEVAVRCLAGVGLWLALAAASLAQEPAIPAYAWPSSSPGYYQPIEFIAPPGTSISLAANGVFTEPIPAPMTFGVLVRPVYRLRVSGIPLAEGREVFPTVELVDRLCAPPGQEARFPIPIEFTADDLRLAIEGHFITRVVYVEDPHSARPVSEDAEHPAWFDAGPGADPLAEAKQYGRPVAIVRLGGRLPDDRTGPDMRFLNGCPPFVGIRAPARLPIEAPVSAPSAAAGAEAVKP